MNEYRYDPTLEHLRDGTDRGATKYFHAQWSRASVGVERDHRHHSSVRQRSNSRIFSTPYAEKYFDGVLPDKLPEHSKVKRVMVVTDLDAMFWYSEHLDPRQGFPTYPDVFFDVVNDLYDEKNHRDSVAQCNALGDFMWTTFLTNMRHMPKAVFHHTESSTAVVVLSATKSAYYHLKQMAGIACLPEMSFDQGEMHEAMMRHEWFHLSKDLHLSDVQMEIEADKVALEGVSSSLRKAWIDARVVGGFMWPIEQRQNGMALFDDDFDQDSAYQAAQMNVVYDWCDNVFKEFYNPDNAIDLIWSIMEDNYDYKSSLSEDVIKVFNHKVLEMSRYGQPYLSSVENFEEWFKADEDPQIADQAWRYLTQANMMTLQLSNCRDLELYRALYTLSESISANEGSNQTIKATVHRCFRNSLDNLLPNVSEAGEGFSMLWKVGQLPKVEYPLGPDIGGRAQQPPSFTIYSI